MDEDEEKDNILKGLSGEVDDYAGKQLPSDGAQGVTIEISIKPHGEGAEPDGDEAKGTGEPYMDAGNPDHDPIAHILGMCCGGKS